MISNRISEDEVMDTSSPRGSTSDDATLVDEYNSWRRTDSHSIKLRETRTNEDGKTSLEFSIEASEQKFTLHCPSHYPDYGNDDNFFVEADSGLQLWCNALNEYLLDTDGQLSLSAILNKGLSLYSAADARSRSRDVSMSSNYNDEDDEDCDDMGDIDDDEDEGHGDDDQLEDILDNDLSWELEIARRRKRWRQKEKELRAARKKSNGSSDSNDESSMQQLYQDPSIKGRQPKQVFSTDAASGILINDLVSIMESAEMTGINADTIEDNIFQWNVKIRKFDSSNLLEKDFEDLKDRQGYDYIELQLDFAMDLYPFFPPLVKVIRPRLQGSMMLRVTTMEILKLSYWNPARNMKEVLVDIKAFLQTWARLDCKSERNDRSRYPDGAYIDIEHHLLRLALVSEMAPRANKKYTSPTPPPPINLPPSALEGAASSSAAAAALLPPPLPLGPSPKELSENPASASTSTATSKDNKEEKKETPKKHKSKFCLFGINKDKESSEEKAAKKKEANQRKNMAKGVGYSSYQQKGWDVKAYMAAQKEKDKQIELVLGKIHLELKKLHGQQSFANAARNLPDLVDGAIISGTAASGSSPEMPTVDVDSRISATSAGSAAAAAAQVDRGGSRRKRKHSPDEAVGANVNNGTDGGDTTASTPIDPLSDLFAVLEGSALIPFLESKLQANSFLEICNHASVYRCVINIIRELAKPCLISLLGPLADQSTSLHSLLLSLEAQAQILLDKIGKSSANGSVPKSTKAATEKVADKSSDDKLAKDFITLSKEVSKALKNTGYWPDINGGPTTAVSSSSSSVTTDNQMDANDEEEEPKAGPSGLATSGGGKKVVDNPAVDLYKKVMKEYQIDTCEFSMSGPNNHAWASSFSKSGMPSSSIIFRVAQELSSLSTSLPLDFSSAIFLRTDDDRPTLMKVLITGPEETPYSGGCFVFDFFFPGKYPASPPQVNFRTTGNGSVRFNPNLYNCGKVCLSLLGTWGGAQGEQWNETSTVLQVLISIQSLILCGEPYYNEPGFERLYGTPRGDAESLKYSEEVFRNNLKYAVLGQLTNPPEGFEDVVRAHFYLKRDVLLEEYEKMTEKFKSRDVKKQLSEVKREFQKLEAPAALMKLNP